MTKRKFFSYNCIICNKLVNSNFIVCTKSDCNYKTHLECLKQVETINDCKTDLLRYSCSSSMIKSVEKSKLVSLSKGCKIFVRKVRDNENHNRCIFCRKLAKNKLDLSCCTEKDCTYGIHSHCLKFVLYKKQLVDSCQKCWNGHEKARHGNAYTNGTKISCLLAEISNFLGYLTGF